MVKRVSICIPAYEQPKNLEKCLESILNQTFKDYEVVITDDSQTGSLISVIQLYSKRMDIKYTRNLIAKGSPENWNEAIKLATGKYIKILHHDDSFRKSTSLEELVKLMEKDRKNAVVFCSSYHVDSKGHYLSSHVLNEMKMRGIKSDPRELFFGNIIGAPSVMMYKREISLKFDGRMKWLVDIDFYIRLLKVNSFTYTDDELISINIGEAGRVTNSCIDNRKINIYETMIMFEKFNLEYLPYAYKFYLFKLFLRFNVTSCKDILECGYDGLVNIQIVGLFKYVILFLPVYKSYVKFKRLLKSVFGFIASRVKDV